MNKVTKLGALLATLISAPSFAGYTIDINDEHKLTLGGYFKADVRNVKGDLAYRDMWVGNNGVKEDTNETRFNVRESRFNVKYQYTDFTGFLEWDFYDDQQPTGTTETVTGGHLFDFAMHLFKMATGK